MMNDIKKEEAISAELLTEFPFLGGNVNIQRARRLWVETPADKFDAVFRQIIDRFSFRILCTITGQDEKDFFSIIYHLSNDNGIILNLKVKVQKSNPKWKSIGAQFPGGIIYEREIADLFGIQIEGLPPGSRYPLPDNWPKCQYPLRKDWQNTSLTSKAGGNA